MHFLKDWINALFAKKYQLNNLSLKISASDRVNPYRRLFSLWRVTNDRDAQTDTNKESAYQASVKYPMLQFFFIDIERTDQRYREAKTSAFSNKKHKKFTILSLTTTLMNSIL